MKLPSPYYNNANTQLAHSRQPDTLAASARPDPVPPYAGLPVAPELPDPDVSAATPSDVYELGRKTVAFGISLSMSFGAVAVPGHTSYHDRMGAQTMVFPDRPLPSNRKQAVAPPAESTRIVSGLLASSQSPDFTTLWGSAKEAYQVTDDEVDYADLMSAQQFAARERIAKRHGLTVFDPTATLRELRTADATLPNAPDRWRRITDAFLRQYALRTDVDPNLAYRSNMQAATPELLRDPSAQRFYIDLVNAIAALPKEFVAATGIQRLLLASQRPDARVVAAAYIYPSLQGPIGNSMVLNLSLLKGQVYTAYTVYHEFGHRWDYLLSGGDGMFQDPDFMTTAGNVPYGLEGPEPAEGQRDTRPAKARKLGWITLKDYEQLQNDVIGQFDVHRSTPHCLAYADSAAATLSAYGARTVFESENAAAVDVSEHKADTWRYIPLGDEYPRLLAPHLPWMTAQLTRELSRLYTHYPQLARYFIDAAKRSDPTTSPQQLLRASCYLRK